VQVASEFSMSSCTATYMRTNFLSSIGSSRASSTGRPHGSTIRFWDFDLSEWGTELWRRHRAEFSQLWSRAWRPYASNGSRS